jgi:hypothetical protein
MNHYRDCSRIAAQVDQAVSKLRTGAARGDAGKKEFQIKDAAIPLYMLSGAFLGEQQLLCCYQRLQISGVFP